MNLDVVILDVCQKELKAFPEPVLEDLLDALARLQSGQMLSMPLSRPMPSIANGVHELRLKDASGAYRVFYYIKKNDAIYLIHAFRKKTQKTPHNNMEIVKKRIRRLS